MEFQLSSDVPACRHSTPLAELSIAPAAQRSPDTLSRAVQILEYARRDAETVGPARRARSVARIGRAERVLKEYEQVLLLAARGMDEREIAKVIACDVRTIRPWLRNSLPPEIARLDPNRPRKLPERWPSNREASTARAYLLGAYQASAIRTGSKRLVSFQSSDPDTMHRLREVLTVVGFKGKLVPSPITRFGSASQSLGVFSQDLVAELADLTGKNTRVPVEHLGTREEQIAYLRGYFSHRGSFSGGFFRVESAAREELLVGLASILGELGVVPTVVATARGTLLQISAYEELVALSATDVLLGEKARTLQGILSEGVEGRHAVTREFFRATIARASIQSPKEIAAATGLPVRQVKLWLVDRDLPKSEKRYRELERIRRAWKLPRCEPTSFLYRERECPVSFARILGSKVRVEMLRKFSVEAFELLARHGISGVDHPEQVVAIIKAREQNRAVSLSALEVQKR